MDKHKFVPQDIYNIDESGLHTVQKPESVVTGLGTKRVGSVTSAERGELVTVVYGISAAGVVIPPMFIFPRVKYNERFIKEAPNGSTGAARSGGWINEEIFLQYLDHIIKFTRCGKEHKILIIMDNHETHISLSAVDKARENVIVFLTIPPHTSQSYNRWIAPALGLSRRPTTKLWTIGSDHIQQKQLQFMTFLGLRLKPTTKPSLLRISIQDLVVQEYFPTTTKSSQKQSLQLRM